MHLNTEGKSMTLKKQETSKKKAKFATNTHIFYCLIFFLLKEGRTRGHKVTLGKDQCRLDIRHKITLGKDQCRLDIRHKVTLGKDQCRLDIRY